MDIKVLKRQLAGLERTFAPAETPHFTFGQPEVDAALGGGLAAGAVHEILALEGADAAAAAGFGLALGLRAAGTRPLVWVRQDLAGIEGGGLYAPGLAAFGLDPDRLILARTKDGRDGLRAAAEALRCPALGAVLLEAAGAARVLDLTATRRLSLAAERSGLPLFLIRHGSASAPSAAPAPSAAMTRWSVASAPSTAMAANAPGRSAFTMTLLRHRAGIPGRSWRVEWDHDRQIFTDAAAPLSRTVVPVPGRRPAAAA